MARVERRSIAARPARLDELGRRRCWACDRIVATGIVSLGTRLIHVCKCHARNLLIPDRRAH